MRKLHAIRLEKRYQKSRIAVLQVACLTSLRRLDDFSAFELRDRSFEVNQSQYYEDKNVSVEALFTSTHDSRSGVR